MGRKNRFSVGAQFGNFEVATVTAPTSSKNRVLQLRCLSCGMLRQVWNTQVAANKLVCQGCEETKYIATLVMHDKAPVLVVTDQAITMVMHGQYVDPSAKVFKFVDGTLALPYVVKAKGKPEPNEGYRAHMVVPKEFLEIYLETEPDSTSPLLIVEANKFYKDNVDIIVPGADIARHASGDGATWVEGGKEYSYLYWRSSETWPKGVPMPDEYRPRIRPVEVKPVKLLTKEEAEASIASTLNVMRILTPEEEAKSTAWREVKVYEDEFNLLEPTLKAAQAAMAETDQSDLDAVDAAQLVLNKAQAAFNDGNAKMLKLKDEAEVRQTRLLYKVQLDKEEKARQGRVL